KTVLNLIEYCILFTIYYNRQCDKYSTLCSLNRSELKMNIFKNKLLWLAPIAAILIFVIFSVAFYTAFNPKPKDIPIAIVNYDKGVDMQGKNINIGKNLEDKLLDSNSNKIKWIQ